MSSSSDLGLPLAFGAVALLAGVSALSGRSGSSAIDPAKRRADLERFIAKGSGATDNERAIAKRALADLDSDARAGFVFLAESKSGKWRITAERIPSQPGVFDVKGTERLPDGRVDAWWTGWMDPDAARRSVALEVINHSPRLIIHVDQLGVTPIVDDAWAAGQYLTGKPGAKYPPDRAKLG